MSTTLWKDEHPTEPGWYWHKQEGEPATAHHIVRSRYDGLLRQVSLERQPGITVLTGYTGWTGKWAGPIEPPPE